MDSLIFKDLLINFTSDFTPLWNDQGSGAQLSVSYWRPIPTEHFHGFHILGDFASSDYNSIVRNRIVAIVSDANGPDGTALRPPVDYQRLWSDTGTGADTHGAIWKPIAPEGYVALGMLCTLGYEKPLLSTMRCIRADLVIASYVGDMIWNDRGSGGDSDFSAWSVQPPKAASGELYFSSGTFIGVPSYEKPDIHINAHALRMQMPLEAFTPSPVPALANFNKPPSVEPSSVTYITRLPWFIVKDPNLQNHEQLRLSPEYRLERSDRFILVGFGHNTSSVTQAFDWTATHGESGGHSHTLSDTTLVEVGFEWQFSVFKNSIKFSAKFNNSVTHTKTSSIGWSTTTSLKVTAVVPSQKAVAVYLIQSDYRLLRRDNGQISTSISYTDGNSVYWSEYPPTPEREVTVSCTPIEQPPSLE